MESYRIILADDHALIRSGIKRLLNENPGLEVVAEAADGLELLNLLNRTTPDLIILDISMPNLRGIEAIHEAKAKRPGVKVLVLTMHRSVELLHLAIGAGADGYILKEDAEVELFSAIEAIKREELYVSPLLHEGLKAAWVKTLRHESEPLAPILTVREREVLKLFGEARSKKEIADLLSISIHTVEHHRANILKKLNLRTTADLVVYAVSNSYT